MFRKLSSSRKKKLELLHPILISEIEELVEPHTQSEVKHRDTKGYVKITASWLQEKLRILNPSYPSFGKTTANALLNRLGYSLKRVQKKRPLKRIEQTEAIFENVSNYRQKDENKTTLRISVDVKDKVKVGRLSRGGYNRSGKVVEAYDKDQQWDASLVPFGVLEFDSGHSTVVYGNSKVVNPAP